MAASPMASMGSVMAPMQQAQSMVVAQPSLPQAQSMLAYPAPGGSPTQGLQSVASPKPAAASPGAGAPPKPTTAGGVAKPTSTTHRNPSSRKPSKGKKSTNKKQKKGVCC